MIFPALSRSLIETECGEIVEVPWPCRVVVRAVLVDARGFVSVRFLLDGDPGCDNGYPSAFPLA